MRTKNQTKNNTMENEEEEEDCCEEWKVLLKSCQNLVQTLFQEKQEEGAVDNEEEKFVSVLEKLQTCHDIDWDANQTEWRNLWNLCYSNHPWMNVRKKTLLVQFVRVVVIPLTRYIWIPNLDMLTLTNFEIQSLYQQTLFQCSTWSKYVPEKEFTSELTWMIHTTYRISSPNLRRQIRTYIGLFLTTTLHHSSTSISATVASHSKMLQDTTMVMVDGVLLLVHCILLGMKTSMENKVEEAWWDHCTTLLLSLHRPNSFILWRDQIPILQQYHEPLCCCLATIIQQDHSRLEGILSACIQEYQSCHNTPKQVLLLHEMDSFLNNTTTTAAIQLLSKSAIVNYMTVIGQACSSDHSRVAQRAMECIQHDYIQKQFLKQIPDLLYPILLKELTHNYTYTLPWNPTVQKRTALILEFLQELHPQLFQSHCHSNNNNNNNNHAITPPPTPNISKESTKVSHVMNQWKQQQKQLIGKNPPSSVTGVAPWAISSSLQNNKSMQPPLTATGVAPWAISSAASKSKIPKISSSRRNPMKQQTPSSTVLAKSYTQKNANDGLKQMSDFIKKCKPKNDVRSKEKDGLLAESPVLLPELKFHDLVFGKVLGTGAFSTVYYARRILPKSTQSVWPEYAVKIVSTTTLREHAYEYNTWREMTILSSMVHPNIARLISTFRFKKGAYFVLEYANYGDLYTVLNRSTPKHTLSEPTSQILLGQVVAALHAIHEAGFVFGDVKPENILVTTSGHVKLSDFGASRPITDETHQLLQRLFTKKTSSFLYQLRNGDWKQDDDANNHNQDKESIAVEEDDRVEGTKAYLPPEVLIYGQKQSIYADTYAFGCVLYQCLTGQLPEEQENDHDQQKQQSKVVQFHSQKDSKTLSSAAHSLIQTCRMTNPNDRPTMMAISTCDFFQSINVFSLYRQPNHNVNLPDSGDSNNNANAADPNWAQRQLSTIWAPQPKAYDLSSTGTTTTDTSPNNNKSKPLTSLSKDPIIAGDEANGYFLTSSSSSHCHKLLPKYHTKPNNNLLTRIKE